MIISKGKFIVATFSVLVVGGMLMSSSASAAGYGGKGGIGGGGGGGSVGCFQSIVPPAGGFSISINSENGTVFSRNVSLTINGGNARRMAVSNDAAFSNVSLETANNSREWLLTEGEGPKSVFVRFYDECGISTSPVSATVTFRATRPTEEQGNEAEDTESDNNGQVLGEKISQIDELIAALRYGRRDDRVLTLQNELVRLGLMPRGWRSTNYYGPVTLAGVTRYVDAHNGNLDEMIGRLTFGQTHPDVRRLSRQLIAGGFMPRGTRISSYYGTAVRSAVARYQAAR